MNRYVLYYPYVKPQIVTKEQLIQHLEFVLEELKNESGAGIVGRGSAWTCLESTDSSTGDTWYSRYSIDEFLEALNLKGGDAT